MMDPKLASIVSMGYSQAQAQQALAENEGDVDDAIDSLFLKRRMKKDNVSSTPAFSDEDVTVTDSIAPTDTSIQGAPPPLATGQFGQRGIRLPVSSSYNTPSFGMAVIGSGGSNRNETPRNSRAAPSGRPPVAAGSSRAATSATSSTRTSHKKEPELAHSPIASPMSDEKVLWSEPKKDIDADSNSDKSSVEESTGQQRRGTVEPFAGLPGAFAVGSSSAVDHTDNDDLVTASTAQPALREITTAELVDPDQENQILELRLQEELERERGKAAVAQVVDESELRTCNKRRITIIVGAVVVVFAVALGVALTRPSTPAPASAPASSPAPTYSPPPQEIVDLIAPVSFDGGESLYDPLSPQSAAAHWLADNTDLDNYTDARKIQRYALATLYFSTNGDEWKDKQEWLSDSNECTDWWVKEFDPEDTRVKCDANNALTSLLIEENNLAGSIPEEIALLSNSLAELKLNENVIGGTLPTTLGLMTRLRDLYFFSNKMTGPIPTEIGLLTTMEDLRLDHNELTGTLPIEMTLMTSLDDLRLGTNNLVGTISPIGSLKKLDTLRLSANEFTGPIPTEIGLLTLLKELKLHRNKLVGVFPTEIGLLNALKDLNVAENALVGTLPTELGLLTALEEELNTAENNFTGTIPSEFASFTSLGRLRMGHNNLTGTILSTLGLLPVLERIELQDNLLVGSIPSELGLLTLMSDLRLYANDLTGTILSEFTQFTEAKFLYFNNNSFSGRILPFGNLTSLKRFWAGFNLLTGSIPTSITRQPKLEQLLLSNNALTGTIPSLDNLQNLEIVQLFNNSLSGNFTCPPKVVDCYISCFVPNNTACRSLN